MNWAQPRPFYVLIQIEGRYLCQEHSLSSSYPGKPVDVDLPLELVSFAGMGARA